MKIFISLLNEFGKKGIQFPLSLKKDESGIDLPLFPNPFPLSPLLF